MIYSTAYVSTLRETLDDADVSELLDHSRENNRRDGITGLLMLRDRRVMQLLEGGESEVRGLFDRIARDPRHDGVVTVWRSVTEQRRFPEWTMGFDDLAEDDDLTAPWPEPTVPPMGDDDAPPARDSTADWLRRRSLVLRRALASGDRMVTALAIILNGHRPEDVLEDDAVVRLRCAECRDLASPDLDRYPCSTARNAVWALESLYG